MAGHMHAVMIHIQIVNNAINTEQVSWEPTAGKERLDQGQKLMRGKRRFPSTFEQSKRPRLNLLSNDPFKLLLHHGLVAPC